MFINKGKVLAATAICCMIMMVITLVSPSLVSKAGKDKETYPVNWDGDIIVHR